jgi:hypothetical protein
MKIKLGKAWFLVLFGLFLIGVFGSVSGAEVSQPSATLYLFSKAGCPHCAREMDFLIRLKAEQPELLIHQLEISESPQNREAFRAVIDRAKIANPGVPQGSS